MNPFLKKVKRILESHKISAAWMQEKRDPQANMPELENVNNALRELVDLHRKDPAVDRVVDRLFTALPQMLESPTARPSALHHVVKYYADIKCPGGAPKENIAQPCLPAEKANQLLAFLANTKNTHGLGKHIAFTLNGLSKLYRAALNEGAVEQVLSRLKAYILRQEESFDEEEDKDLGKTIAMAIHGAGAVVAGHLQPGTVQFFSNKLLQHLGTSTDPARSISMLLFGSAVKESLLNPASTNRLLEAMSSLWQPSAEAAGPDFRIAMALYGAKRVPDDSLDATVVNTLLEQNWCSLKTQGQRHCQTLSMSLQGATQVPKGSLAPDIANAYLRFLLEALELKKEGLDDADLRAIGTVLSGAAQAPQESLHPKTVNALLAILAKQQEKLLQSSQTIALALYGASEVPDGTLDIAVCEKLVRCFCSCGPALSTKLQASIVCQCAYHYKLYDLLLEQNAPTTWPQGMKAALTSWQCEALRKQKRYQECIAYVKVARATREWQPMSDADKRMQCCLGYCYLHLEQKKEAYLLFAGLEQLGEEDPFWPRMVSGLVFSGCIPSPEKERYAKLIKARIRRLETKPNPGPGRTQQKLQNALEQLAPGAVSN